MQKHILRHSQERYTVRGSSLYFLITKDPEIVPSNIFSFLGVEDPEIIPGNTLSKYTGLIIGNILSNKNRILKSYQAIYFPQVEVSDIIPVSIRV